MDYIRDIVPDFVRLARLGLAGRPQDVQLFVHRVAKKYGAKIPELGDMLTALLREGPTRSSPLRKHADQPVPVDLDSRLQLLRVEAPVELDPPPILPLALREKLLQLLGERGEPQCLLEAGLQPTRTVLFTGAPGVGKTMTAKWLAQKMGRPLLVLDLAAVMSSYLGRTGNNVRNVLDYAKAVECVLLLDEFDTIAKRRDDGGEVGELKRLVTVLLQEVDDWPASGLLIAATNHPDLLDPAIWRRFEMVLSFPMPEQAEIERMIENLLSGYIDDTKKWAKILGFVFSNRSFSDLERHVNAARRAAAVRREPLSSHLQNLVRDGLGDMQKAERIRLAIMLVEHRVVSQRQAHELTGVSRDTIRKAVSTPGDE